MMKDTAFAATHMDDVALPRAAVSRPRRAAVDPRIARRRAEEREFNITWTILFTIFLVVAFVTRPLPRSWRPLGSHGGQKKSIIGEARCAAYVVTPFVFMR